MSFLEDKNQKVNSFDLEGGTDVEFEKELAAGQESLGKPSAPGDDKLVLDLDQELQKNQAKDTAGATGDVEKSEAASPAMNLPTIKSGNNVPSALPVKDEEIIAKLPDNGSEMSSSTSSFSLLPVDEESILYVDFPAALRRILYSFVIGGILLLALWFGANYFLNQYFVEANNMQQSLRALSLEKLKYQTTDADVRLRYQYYKTLNQLLVNHVTWQYFFKMLEKYTAPEVYFNNFSVNIMNDNNKIMFSAYANSLKAALKQYMVMKNYAAEFCDDVSISGLSLLKKEDQGQLKEEGVSFNLTFSVKAELFNSHFVNSLSK